MMPFFKIGDDKTIKQWNMEAPGYGEEEEPINTILGKVCFFFFSVFLQYQSCASKCFSKVL